MDNSEVMRHTEVSDNVKLGAFRIFHEFSIKQRTVIFGLITWILLVTCRMYSKKIT